MKTPKSLFVAAAVALTAALVCGAAAASDPAEAAGQEAAGDLVPADLPVLEASARAVYRTARYEARARFWLKVAEMLQEPWDEFPAGLEEAQDDLRDDLDLAEAQYNARLDLRIHFGGAAYDPKVEPADFTTAVTNEYMPLVPGRTMIYEKHTAEGVERKEVTTLNKTFVVGGFECRVVRELELFNGVVVEESINWCAQHQDGSVWYFGEIAKHYEDGVLDNLDGSWRVGKNGAKPGILMLASPAIGDVHRQEYSVNVSEDISKVISTDSPVHVPYGAFQECLLMADYSPLEPDDLTTKFYAPSLGLVLEVDRATGDRLELVQVIN